MKNRFLRMGLLAVAVISVCSLNGCASIISSSKSNLPIITEPDEATCEITDLSSGLMISKAKTPHTALLDASAGFFQSASYNIKLQKEGYIPYETRLEAGVNGWYFGNIVFGGLLGILIVDPATGAMWKIHDDKIKIKLYKDSPEGRLSMAKDKYSGMKAYAKKNYDLAINETTKGLEIAPEFYEGYCVRGASRNAKGELAEALADINKAIELNPELPNAYKERGEIYQKQGETNKAIEQFNKAISIKPDYADALFSRGYYYKSINKKELAKADISLACKKGSARACNFQTWSH